VNAFYGGKAALPSPASVNSTCSELPVSAHWRKRTRRLAVFGSFLGTPSMRVIRTPCSDSISPDWEVEIWVVVVVSLSGSRITG
jgi:hypothetical protein